MKRPEARIRSGLSALGSNATLSTSAYTAIGPLALATPRHTVITRTAVAEHTIDFISPLPNGNPIPAIRRDGSLLCKPTLGSASARRMPEQGGPSFHFSLYSASRNELHHSEGLTRGRFENRLKAAEGRASQHVGFGSVCSDSPGYGPLNLPPLPEKCKLTRGDYLALMGAGIQSVDRVWQHSEEY